MSEEGATTVEEGTTHAQGQDSGQAAGATGHDNAQESSSASDTTEGAAKAGAKADSSAEQGKGTTKQGEEKKPATAFEAVKARYDAHRTAEEARQGKAAPQNPESPPEETGKKPEEKAPEKNADAGKKEDLLGLIEQEEWNRIPGKTRKRIEQFRSAVKERDQRIQTLEPAAKAHQGVVEYCKQNKVTPENFSYALGLIAAVNNDPERAWKSLQPIIAHLRQQVGEELPPELAARVEKGELSQDAARELARTQGEAERSRRALADRQSADETARREGEAQRSAEATHAEATKHLATWEAQWKSSDADYSKKWPHVWKRMQPELRAVAAGGKPVTKDVVAEIADRARRDVEELLSVAAPQRREVRTVNGGTSSQARPVPKTSFDAVKAAYDAARAA